MKITNWAKACSCVSIMALSLLACGTQQDVASENNSDRISVQPLPAAEVANRPDMIARVEIDANGNVLGTEVRALNGQELDIQNAQQAEAMFADANTANDDTSADSYYHRPRFCAPTYGPFLNQTTTISQSTFIGNNCHGFGGINYGAQWPGYNYNIPNNNFYSSQTYYNSTTVSNNNVGIGGIGQLGLPVAQRFPVFGCRTGGIHCFNYANVAWPTYYRRFAPVRNLVGGVLGGVRNALYGYRYPFARSFGNIGLGGRRFRYIHYPCRWNRRYFI